MSRTSPMSIEEVAIRLIDRYGRAGAIQLAAEYASGVFFQQSEHGRAHWLAVEAKIRELQYG